VTDLGLDARTAYDELLADGDLLAASTAALAEGQQRHGIAFGGVPLSVSLRPSILGEARWSAAVTAAHAVRSALDTLEQALVADEELRRELELAPDEETLALAPPGSRSSSPSVRLDSFFADEVRYVEYNAESPAGIAYGDVLADVFESLPVMRRFSEDWAVRPLPARDAQLGAMRRAFYDWGGSGSPSMAIVDWAGLPTLTEFEMFRSYFATQGIACCICEPATLTYEGGVLRACDGTAVDLVYRRVLTSELLAAGGLDQPLCRAYLDGAAVVVNSFRAKLLHKKMSLALMSDERHASVFSAAQREAIARHVPWTRRVADGPSTRDGAPLPDLVAHVIAGREGLVLKPNDEYGGKGVVLGWTVDEPQWEAALETALDECYVVQEAVPVPRERFPTMTEGGDVSMIEMSVDMDPYLFDGEVRGVMTRLSSSALLNVTAGEGSLVPTFVVEGRR
jgi:hypothetical protein